MRHSRALKKWMKKKAANKSNLITQYMKKDHLKTSLYVYVCFTYFIKQNYVAQGIFKVHHQSPNIGLQHCTGANELKWKSGAWERFPPQRRKETLKWDGIICILSMQVPFPPPPPLLPSSLHSPKQKKLLHLWQTRAGFPSKSPLSLSLSPSSLLKRLLSFEEKGISFSSWGWGDWLSSSWQ